MKRILFVVMLGTSVLPLLGTDESSIYALENKTDSVARVWIDEIKDGGNKNHFWVDVPAHLGTNFRTGRFGILTHIMRSDEYVPVDERTEDTSIKSFKNWYPLAELGYYSGDKVAGLFVLTDKGFDKDTGFVMK